jgi:hypothetical protein
MLFTVSKFNPSLIFANKGGAYQSGAIIGLVSKGSLAWHTRLATYALV